MPRETPFGAYNFIVEFDGNEAANTALGGFSDVSGIGTEITLMEYRQGNDKENRVRKIPGMHKAGDVTLKRGIMGQVNFWDWIRITRVDPTHKRTVMITLQDEQRNAVLRWKLINARPMKFTGPTLAAKGGSDVAMEELVVAVEDLEFVTE
ncbi:phage tail protein [Sphingomonas gei]|jgi:phage tail-like protein|uniref:Phage tail protein n=1 Tax=Sphingomonas gei TaxID=1395960 RepID=A0A4S1XCX9_9SPHN|nr:MULTISPECIES: phage tail protein [Sphingomonas]TGX53685.1 phage tail protein [Sphingomonas gei]WBY06474.1 phage tail protein [Sphingomonas sp. 7/4-4]